MSGSLFFAPSDSCGFAGAPASLLGRQFGRSRVSTLQTPQAAEGDGCRIFRRFAVRRFDEPPDGGKGGLVFVAFLLVRLGHVSRFGLLSGVGRPLQMSCFLLSFA
jgi:hypothetical protein